MLLEQVGLEGQGARYPRQLSGGMLARLAIARAFAINPQIMLLDEAFNFLDEPLRERMNDLVRKFVMDNSVTAVAVTHSVMEAVFMSDHVAILTAKPARLIEIVDIPFDRARSRDLMRTPKFLAICDFIRAKLAELPQ